MLGAVRISPSSTMANWPSPPVVAGHCGSPLKQSAAAALNRSMPSSPSLNVGFTTHSPVWFSPAVASSTAGPSSSVGPRR